MFRKGGKSTSVIRNGRRHVRTTFDGRDDSELIEEFDVKTDELVVRKRRSRSVLGKMQAWEYLVGDAPCAVLNSDTGPSMMESSNGVNPLFSRSIDSAAAFVWRVRYLPYPLAVYAVTVDVKSESIVIKTSNKKYYKSFQVPEMRSLGLKLNPSDISWEHGYNTLVVQYKKPREVLAAEIEERLDRLKIETLDPNEKLGDSDGGGAMTTTTKGARNSQRHQPLQQGCNQQ